MKSFKHYLIESIIDDGDGMGGPNDMSGRNRVPPGSIPAPKGPRPTVLYPFNTSEGPMMPPDFPDGGMRFNGMPEIDYDDIQREMRELEWWWGYYEELLRKHHFNLTMVATIICAENPLFCYQSEPRVEEVIKKLETYLRNKYPWAFKLNPITGEPLIPTIYRTFDVYMKEFRKRIEKSLEEMRERHRNRPRPFGPFS
jgi:hypothetical protein